MEDILVIGAGPAGLLAAWVARERGAQVRVLAAGIGTTHIMPGGLAVLRAEHDLRGALAAWVADHPAHPYALAGEDALQNGLAALREVCAPAGLHYVGDLRANYRLPTALGALTEVAVVPESFLAGDLRQTGALLIAGPAGWRDFYPGLCAGNLARQGVAAEAATFELPELHASKFDATAAGLARLLEQADVRARVAAELRGRLNGAARVGLPAILGLERHAETWRELQDRVGVPVFEIPTLPPSVSGMRLWLAFKAAFARCGIRLLLDMPVARGLTAGRHASGVAVAGAARETEFRADRVILATGGLYGGGIESDHEGALREAVFGLPVTAPVAMPDWFAGQMLRADHPIHQAGVRVNRMLQPLDAAGEIVLENVRVAGRLLGGYNPLIENSAEGVWLATAYRAATC